MTVLTPKHYSKQAKKLRALVALHSDVQIGILVGNLFKVEINEEISGASKFLLHFQ